MNESTEEFCGEISKKYPELKVAKVLDQILKKESIDYRPGKVLLFLTRTETVLQELIPLSSHELMIDLYRDHQIQVIDNMSGSDNFKSHLKHLMDIFFKRAKRLIKMNNL